VQEYWAVIEPLLRAAHEPRPSIAPYPNPPPFGAEHAMPNVESARRPISGGLAPNPGSSPRPSQGAPLSAGGTRLSGVPPSRIRTPESAAANPAAWSWQVTVRSIAPGTIRAALFAPNGDYALAVGPSGLARLERGAWVAMNAPAAIDLRSVRGLKWLSNGDLLVFGARALAARLSPTGTSDTWAIPDQDITFLGAHAEDSGVTTLVGERPARHGQPAQPARTPGSSTIGALAQFVNDRVTLVSDAASCTRLRAGTRLRGGTFVACGDWGTLVRLEMGVADHVGSVCGGHLSSIEALDDGGAVTVGVGGHALYVTPRLEAHLEAVQTTRDLLSLAIGEDGAAWAGAAQARLLRRSGGSWVRMSGDVGIAPGVVAIWAGSRVVRAVCDDGAVLEGRLA
jgi:hypothetical protein